MVLERIISIRDALRRPVWMFIIGGVISVACSFIALLIFPSSPGWFSVFLITFTMTPFMVNLMIHEEVETEEEIEKRLKLNFFQRHTDILRVYMAFFSGMIFALTILFLALPQNTAEKLFEDQIKEINLIRGSFALPSTFEKIFFNNIGVMILSFLFAFLFGSGAIFILAWNASVLSAAIGLTAKSIGGAAGLPVAVLTFLPHGSFEIIAYFIAGIAGGLVSAVVVRKKSKWFWVVIQDGFKMIGISVFFLVIGAIIETMLILF